LFHVERHDSYQVQVEDGFTSNWAN